MANRRIKVIEGENYSSLVVIREIESIKLGKHRKRIVLCKCECGQEVKVRLEYLRSGHTTSCGCASVTALINHRRTHGMTGTRLHGIWNGMKGRCYNKNRKSYKDYGEKGVRVCKEWHDFEPFYLWAINNGYEDHLTIERKDPFGNYEPSNCEWIPKSDQGKNKRCHAVTAHD